MRAYEAKLTGALADRIDISIAVEQPDLTSFAEPGEASAAVRERVLAARERQLARIGDERANGELAASEIELSAEVERLLAEAGFAAGLSGRGRERVIRLARTVADLDGADADRASTTSARRSRCGGGPDERGAAGLGDRARLGRLPVLPRATSGSVSVPQRSTAVAAARLVAALDHGSTVTIVGTRRPSAYGLRVAEQLARELALAGVTVVSGMARGIDAAAHRGALAGGGTTLAVLANGPDVVYPPVNRELYERHRRDRRGDLRASGRGRGPPPPLPGAQPDHGGARRTRS